MDLFNSEEVIAKPELEAFEDDDDHKPDLASFLSDAKMIDPELLAATIGPLLYPNISIWDVILQKTKQVMCHNVKKAIIFKQTFNSLF